MCRRRPRRAGKRWVEGAPEYILDVLDNKGKTIDRYTVLFGGSLWDRETDTVPYLGMSGSPSHPQGVSMWGEFSRGEAASYRYKNGRERIKWTDLPGEIRKHVIARAEE